VRSVISFTSVLVFCSVVFPFCVFFFFFFKHKFCIVVRDAAVRIEK